MQSRVTTIALLGFFFASCQPAFTATVENVENKVFVGYVSGMPKEINYKLYTHLCHAFVVAEKDGTLIPQQNVPNHQLAREAHLAGVKVLVSLGGWGWDEKFAAISLDPLAEDRYVSAVMNLVDKFDYDGIDLDWEYPDTNIEIVGFERLARRFRQALDELGNKKNRQMLLTMAAAAHPTTLEWLDNDFLLETMDWINVMTYDYCGSWAKFAGHHSPLFASSKMPAGEVLSTEMTISYLTKRGLPANRLALGLPLYGRAFAVSEPYANTTTAPKPRRESANYREIEEMIQGGKWVRKWDDETKNPWLISPDRSKIIGYDDSESVAIKTQWAKEQGLRGVFFWQIDADRSLNGTNPVQASAYEKLYKKSP